jgi:hypothetical protein
MKMSSSASEFTLSVLQLDFVESFDDFSMSAVSVLLAVRPVIFDDVGFNTTSSKEEDEERDDFVGNVYFFVDNEVEQPIGADTNPEIRKNFAQPKREITFVTLV